MQVTSSRPFAPLAVPSRHPLNYNVATYVVTNLSLDFGMFGSSDTIKWIENRLLLFKQYTLPSVQNQIQHPFRWYLYACSKHKELILDLLGKLPPWCEITFITQLTTNRVDLTTICIPALTRRQICKNNHSNQPVIVARLDSDDMISFDYIKVLGNIASYFLEVRFNQSVVVAFSYGLQYDVEGRAFNILNWPEPAFAASVIPRFGTSTPLITEFAHDSIPISIPLTHIATTQPMWVQLITPTNISNRSTGFRVNEPDPTFLSNNFAFS